VPLPSPRRPALQVRPLQRGDHLTWQKLSAAYHAFYGRTLPPGVYDETWNRLMRGDNIWGLAAVQAGTVVGIAHYLRHPSVWFADVLYMQDLFVSESARGQGAGKALIHAVAGIGRSGNCRRLYWHTKLDNDRARRLYDAVSEFNGFIRYEYPLSSS
jgi:GNAT superfamily N-acetyltransferase